MKYEHMDMIIAPILVVGCLVLIGLGIDGEVKAILAMAAGWTFKGGYNASKTSKGGK